MRRDARKAMGWKAMIRQIFASVVMVLGNGSAIVPIFADILSAAVQLPTTSCNATYRSGGQTV